MTSESGRKVTPGPRLGASFLTLCRVCDKQEVVVIWIRYAFSLSTRKLGFIVFRCNGSSLVFLEGSARSRWLYCSRFGAHGYNV